MIQIYNKRLVIYKDLDSPDVLLISLPTLRVHKYDFKNYKWIATSIRTLDLRDITYEFTLLNNQIIRSYTSQVQVRIDACHLSSLSRDTKEIERILFFHNVIRNEAIKRFINKDNN